MEKLPVELRREILRLLSLESLKAIRLVSKAWALLGEDYLIPSTFTAYPHRDDFRRLLSLSQHPRLSSFIEVIRMNLGEVNEYHARHNTYFLQYAQEPDYREKIREEAWAYHGQLKFFKEIYKEHACELDSLMMAFRSLPNLKEIDVSLHKSPGFTNELFKDIWRFPSTRALPRVLTWERFTSVLSAVASSPIHLETLSHDRLPFEFFAQRPLTISYLSIAFNRLQALNLQMDYSESPNDIHKVHAMIRLAKCLCSAPLLRDLRLGFQSRTNIDIDILLMSLERDAEIVENLERFTLGDVTHDSDINASDEIPQILSTPIFPHLTTLRLEGVAARERFLTRFLFRHAPTLLRFSLGGPGIEAPHQRSNGGFRLLTGRLKSLLTSLREGLHLEKFNAQGEIKEVETGLFWELAPVYDKDWVKLPWVLGVTRDYEGFVVRGESWPE